MKEIYSIHIPLHPLKVGSYYHLNENFSHQLERIPNLEFSIPNEGKFVVDIELKIIDDYLWSIWKTEYDSEKIIKDRYPDLNSVDLKKIVEFQQCYFSEYLYEKICVFFIACNLAIPACVSINKSSYSFCNEQKFLLPKFLHSLENLRDFEDDNIFPDFMDLPILKTWNYLQKLDGFIGGTSKSNVGRAVNCYTNFFKKEDGWFFPEYFLWGMIGLEALYGQGNQGMLNQLLEKSRIFLNYKKNPDKTIKLLYDFRSRLFHGQINIQSGFGTREDDEESYQHFDKEFNNSIFASSLLIVSLQKCIAAEITDLKFFYSLNCPTR